MPLDVDVAFIGARRAAWLLAQLHLFFASFALGAPIFIVLSEYLGMPRAPHNLRVRVPLALAIAIPVLLLVVIDDEVIEQIVLLLAGTVLVGMVIFVQPLGDARYERLAHETMKLVTIVYSFAALTGGMFAFVLMGPYASFTANLFDLFGPVFAGYGLLLVVETVFMYVYWYSWRPLANRKGLHITIGVMLNVVGTVMMFLMNAVGSYMLTPPEAVLDANLWELIHNPSWSGLNLHRFVANITLGGFMVALFAAINFLMARTREERAFYDWMGFIGNFIGVATLMAMPLAGYIYAKELFLYDAVISTFMMADKLSFFFVFQGVLVALLFLGVNYYMWMSIERISGSAPLMRYMRPTFIVLFVATAIWIMPQNFLPDLTADIPSGTSPTDILIPERTAFLGMMMAKALAVTAIIIFTFFTYMVYRRALSRGEIQWGRIAPESQYALIFVPAVAVFTMGLMGAIRELARQDWHVFLVLADETEYAFTTPLGETSVMVGVVTLIFFAVMAFVFAVGFRMDRPEAEGEPIVDPEPAAESPAIAGARAQETV